MAQVNTSSFTTNANDLDCRADMDGDVKYAMLNRIMHDDDVYDLCRRDVSE